MEEVVVVMGVGQGVLPYLYTVITLTISFIALIQWY
jgi:hypothetical protein